MIFFWTDNRGNPGVKVAPLPGIEPRFLDSQPSMLPMDHSESTLARIALSDIILPGSKRSFKTNKLLFVLEVDF
jgi:hypothetical protein